MPRPAPSQLPALLVALLALGSTTVPPMARAETIDRNYQTIIDRNPFALKPPPPPAPPTPTTPPQPPVNLNLSGISVDPTGKHAWFVANVPGKQPPTLYYNLIEGEKQDDIEVVSIDERNESVKILNAGVPVTLTFNTHGIKSKTPVAAPAQNAGPGNPGAPVNVSMPAPGGAPNTTAPGPVMVGRGGNVVSPSPTPGANTFITQPSANNTIPGLPGVSSMGGTSPNVIPTRAIRTQGTEATPAPEVQYLMMTADKVDKERKGIPMPPLPPIPGAPPTP